MKDAAITMASILGVLDMQSKDRQELANEIIRLLDKRGYTIVRFRLGDGSTWHG